MGWTSYYRAPGQTDREHLQRELFGDGSKATILDSTTVRGVFYAAVKIQETGQVWALIVLQQRTRGAYNYFRKEISEDMGPGDFDCPDRILDLLTPTESEWANYWRDRCRNANERKRLVKVSRGDMVTFAASMRFGNGTTADMFEWIERSTFWALDDGGCKLFRCRIPSWKNRAHTVTRAA